MRLILAFPGPSPSLPAILLAGMLAACTPEPPPEPAPDALPEPETVFELPALDDTDYRWIAALIYRNEAHGQVRNLTHWGAGEDFPSLGIGHFIWFPAGVDAPFDESFPALVDYLEREQGGCRPMPAWLAERHRQEFDAPWPDKATFDAALDSGEMQELRQWLRITAPQQARFIVANFVERWNRLKLPADEMRALTGLLERMVEVPQGLFAVIDYVNFKGLGTNPRERYRGHGWGLLQVLRDVAVLRQPQDGPLDLVRLFSDAAAGRLKNRAALAPPGRDEERWVPGWIRRVSQYPNEHPSAAPDAASSYALPEVRCDHEGGQR